MWLKVTLKAHALTFFFAAMSRHARGDHGNPHFVKNLTKQ